MAKTSHRKRKSKATPLRRYVYLMERITEREWKSVKTMRREIKIGVSKDGHDRRGQVDTGIPGKVVFLEQYKVNAATRVENMLHTKYKKYNFHVKRAKTGAGGTEFYRLKNSQLRSIRNELARIEIEGLSGQLDKDHSIWGRLMIATFVLSLIVITYLSHQ